MGSCCGSDRADALKRAPLVRQAGNPQQNVMPCQPVQQAVAPVLPPVHALRMHLDEDRDAAIDAAPANAANWTWGPAGAGATILVNTKLHTDGTVVDARSEIAFRWVQDAPDAHGAAWSATLTVHPHARAKVFTARTKLAADANALPVAAPIDLKSPAVQALYGAAGRFSLWIEATAFPASAVEADWRVTLTFDFTDTQGAAFAQVVEVRIAPWIMASDLDPTARAYVVEHSSAVAMPNPSLQHAIDAVAVAGGAASLLRPWKAGQPFLRDVMKPGFLHAPHHQQIAALRGLETSKSKFFTLGIVPPGGSIQPMMNGTQRLALMSLGESEDGVSNQDQGGNLLVTPPIPGFPHGRIVYGHVPPRYSCRMHDFFGHQRVQAPFHVNSSWLGVGHVDEFISFLPDPAHPAWPWKILLMSPRLGYAIAWLASARNAIPAAQIPQLLADAATWAEESRIANHDFAALRGNIEGHGAALLPVGGVTGALGGPGAYDADPPPPALTNGKMVRYDRGTHWVQDLSIYLLEAGHAACYNLAQPAIDAARATLLARLGVLGQDRILEIPALLRLAEGMVGTDTADSVNMLVVRNAQTHVLVPTPFGPVAADTYLFREYIAHNVAPLVNGLTFINDWDEFHRFHGEVHCGTNQEPFPMAPGRAWWLHQEPNNPP